MKCNLNLLKENNISYSYTTLLVGIRNNLLNNNDIANYTTEYLIEHPYETNFKITELACINRETLDVESLLTSALKSQSITIEPETIAWFIEERKLRLCLLLNLKEHTQCKRELLEKIAEVYAEFNYPSEMEEFIYYMPAKNYDPSQHSEHENEQRLLTLFNAFLEKEKNDLKNPTRKIF